VEAVEQEDVRGRGRYPILRMRLRSLTLELDRLSGRSSPPIPKTVVACVKTIGKDEGRRFRA